MIDWMTKMVDEAGSIGIALLMLLENVFPPIPPVDGTGGAL